MKIRWFAEHLEEVLGAFLLGSMACLAFANVLARYLFHYPLAFTEELEVNSLVWLTMLGTAAAFRRNRHLRLIFFLQRLPTSIQRWLNLLMALVGVLLFIVLGCYGYLQILDERELEITSEALGIQQWYYTLSIPVGAALIILRLLGSTIKNWREAK